MDLPVYISGQMTGAALAEAAKHAAGMSRHRALAVYRPYHAMAPANVAALATIACGRPALFDAHARYIKATRDARRAVASGDDTQCAAIVDQRTRALADIDALLSEAAQCAI